MIQRLPGPKGQLNAFQRLMYDWSELHPYNATHTFRLVGPARVDARHQAIRETYFLNRLGVVHLDAERSSYHHETDYAPQLQVVSGGGSPERCLSMSCVRCCR